MIIKSGKENTESIVFLFVLILVLFIAMYVGHGTLRGAFIVAGVPFLMILRCWVATGRTLIMNEDGCTVCFLWYRKTYYWDELQLKRIENYKNSYEYKSPYLEGAVFSAKMVHKPRWRKPASYSILVHPLSFFFVYFKPEKLSKAEKQQCIPFYEVDKLEFLRKMEEWGVRISGI